MMAPAEFANVVLPNGVTSVIADSHEIANVSGALGIEYMIKSSEGTLGVFVILSMQRPNAKVLDTTIRANLTVSMGFKLRDVTESRIVNIPNAHEIDVSGRFIMNSDKLYELQAPYLTLKNAKRLLEPFLVVKEAKKVEGGENSELNSQLLEEDVFLDAID